MFGFSMQKISFYQYIYHFYSPFFIYFSMNIQISLILSFLAGLGTFLGSLLIFIPKLNKKSCIPIFLSISATIMLAFSILDLIPESVFYINSNSLFPYKLLYIFIPFILGVITINIIDKLYVSTDNLLKIGVLSFISLCIHNFPEGIATFLSSMINIKLGLSLTIGIMLHNIPEGICIALPLYQATKSKTKVMLSCLLVSISEPLGGIIAYLFLRNNINNLTISIILLFVSGLMITLSINNIYKEVIDKKTALLKGIAIGLVITIIALLM